MTLKTPTLTKFGLWLALCVAHYVVRTHAILNGPRDNDLYAYTWGFQAVAFLLFRFPFWLLALAGLLGGDVARWLRPNHNETSPDHAPEQTGPIDRGSPRPAGKP